MTDATDRLPQFVIAGAPKAGTTALHAALATHPGLYLSPVKEPSTTSPTAGRRHAAGSAARATHTAPGVDLAGREYLALFDGAPAGRPGRAHRSTSTTGRRSAAGGRRARDQGDRGGPGPGGPGVLELGAPARRRAGAGGGLRGRGGARGPADRRWLGAVLALPGTGGGTASSCATCTRTSRGTGSSCCATASSWTPRGRPSTGSAFLGVPAGVALTVARRT